MGMKHAFYGIIRDKKVVVVDSMEEWSQWLESIYKNQDSFNENLCVGFDIIGVARISTVFLRVNHGFFDKQLWFETMIFGGAHDGYQERYETWDEALAGHEKAKSMVETR